MTPLSRVKHRGCHCVAQTCICMHHPPPCVCSACITYWYSSLHPLTLHADANGSSCHFYERVLRSEVAQGEHILVEALRLVRRHNVRGLLLHLHQGCRCHRFHAKHSTHPLHVPPYQLQHPRYVRAPQHQSMHIFYILRMYRILSKSQEWLAVFSTACAFEFTLMSCAELLVLHRYLDLAFKGLNLTQQQLGTMRRYFAAGCFVLFCNGCDILSSCVVANYRLETSRQLAEGANLCASCYPSRIENF